MKLNEYIQQFKDDLNQVESIIKGKADEPKGQELLAKLRNLVTKFEEYDRATATKPKKALELGQLIEEISDHPYHNMLPNVDGESQAHIALQYAQFLRGFGQIELNFLEKKALSKLVKGTEEEFAAACQDLADMLFSICEKEITSASEQTISQPSEEDIEAFEMMGPASSSDDEPPALSESHDEMPALDLSDDVADLEAAHSDLINGLDALERTVNNAGNTVLGQMQANDDREIKFKAPTPTLQRKSLWAAITTAVMGAASIAAGVITLPALGPISITMIAAGAAAVGSSIGFIANMIANRNKIAVDDIEQPKASEIDTSAIATQFANVNNDIETLKQQLGETVANVQDVNAQLHAENQRLAAELAQAKQVSKVTDTHSSSKSSEADTVPVVKMMYQSQGGKAQEVKERRPTFFGPGKSKSSAPPDAFESDVENYGTTIYEKK